VQRLVSSYCTFDQFLQGLGHMTVYQQCGFHVHDAQSAFLFAADGMPGVNFAGRLEHFERDFTVVLRRIDPTGRMLDRFRKNGFRILNDSGHRPYQEYFWEEGMKEAVAAYYAADMQLGYRFATRGEPFTRTSSVSDPGLRADADAFSAAPDPPSPHPADQPVAIFLLPPSTSAVLPVVLQGLAVGAVYRIDLYVKVLGAEDETLEENTFQLFVGVEKEDEGRPVSMAVTVSPDVTGSCIATALVFDTTEGLSDDDALLTRSMKRLVFPGNVRPWPPGNSSAAQQGPLGNGVGTSGVEDAGGPPTCQRGCRLVCLGQGRECRQVCGFKGHCRAPHER